RGTSIRKGVYHGFFLGLLGTRSLCLDRKPYGSANRPRRGIQSTICLDTGRFSDRLLALSRTHPLLSCGSFDCTGPYPQAGGEMRSRTLRFLSLTLLAVLALAVACAATGH